MTIRFDEAWSNAFKIGREVTDTHGDVVLIRDLIGRISLAIDDRNTRPSKESLAEQITSAAGNFASPDPVLYWSDLFVPEDIFNSPDLIVKDDRSPTHGQFAVLERGVVGAEWLRSQTPRPGRVTLYGFKGGVGRSTAGFILAQHLAAIGKCVLVVDLDLESPGIGSLLQNEAELPEYGIVDYLIESGVNNHSGLDLVTRCQASGASGNGEVWLAPASGKPRVGYDYLAKLNRVYSDLPPDQDNKSRTFASRLTATLEACEQQVRDLSRDPDVVLLDSRAGVHDIAAVAIAQLSDLSLLFATNSPPTWTGYGTLFSQRNTNLDTPQRDRIRRQLKMVAAMVPSASRTEYLAAYRDRAQECFAETLYDDEQDQVSLEAFNFGPDDETAPHYPIPIMFNSDLVGLDPTRDNNWHDAPLTRAAYDDFLRMTTDLIPLDGA